MNFSEGALEGFMTIIVKKMEPFSDITAPTYT